jgi:Endonuclease/Exonuclease/phosphatase family
MKKEIIEICVLIFLFTCITSSQIRSKTYQEAKGTDTLFIASWNLENLFDVVHDPGKNDEEFTPEGRKQWTQDRLDHKLYNLSRVIRTMNYQKGPDLLSVVEVEHKALLDSLTSKYLKDFKYKVAYAESPDERGIDNGLIYRSDLFHLISIKSDTIHLADNWPTRLILNVNLQDLKKDTLHLFINHWPSRIGGETESEPNRIAAAKVLRENVDQYIQRNSKAKIIILGDFNDMPNNKSILDYLKAEPFECDSSSNLINLKLSSGNSLFNLAYSAFNNGQGTYKYKNYWNMLDQIIVSENVINNKKFHYVCRSFQVFKPWFIVTHSGKYEGTPFPTYGGNRYLGGYSDHFPVTAEFILN